MVRTAAAATVDTMELGIYAHPWDLRALDAHGGLRRLCDLGFRDVALAVSYHAGRWLTPWQKGSKVRFLEDGTVHYRPRGDYGRLQPKESSEVRGSEPSPLEWLCEHAPRTGLRARAWAVLTHNTRLGELHPDCCVQNAFGDAYTYSLCHANDHVQRYAVAMVRDLCAHPGLDAIELEAIGSLGHRHSSHHDKNSFPANAFTDALMSACFCGACMRGMAELKIGEESLGEARTAALRAKICSLLAAHFDQDCMSVTSQKHTPQQLLDQLQADVGHDVVAILGQRTISFLKMLMTMQTERPSSIRISAQTNFDSLRGNAALPFAVVGGFVQECAMTVYGEKAADVASSLPHVLAATGEAARPAAPQPALRLCLHPRTPQYQTDEDLVTVRELCRQHGIGSISIYHMGLLPWRTIERAARVLTA